MVRGGSATWSSVAIGSPFAGLDSASWWTRHKWTRAGPRGSRPFSSRSRSRSILSWSSVQHSASPPPIPNWAHGSRGRDLSLLHTTIEARQVIALTPGARPDQIWGGASEQANSYVLDGTQVNHAGLGGALFVPSPSWIETPAVLDTGVLALDGFNVLGDQSVTAIQIEVNSPAGFFGDDYGRVRARVPPRTLRLGAGVKF
jgi:hypothetical protein